VHPDASCHPRHRPVRAPIVLALEGLCCAGKTTLAHALATQPGAVAIPEYTELAALPPWPPRHREDVIVALRHFLHLERQRATLAHRAPGTLVVLDRSPLSVIAHEFGVDRLKVPCAPTSAAHLFARAAQRGLILTPDACIYLRVPARVRAARQACRGALPAHLIDPCAQAGIEAAAARYLDAVPLRRRLVLEGTAPLGELVHAIERFLVKLPPPGEQTLPSWRILADAQLLPPNEERSA
jgi:thymidylate kinase